MPQTFCVVVHCLFFTHPFHYTTSRPFIKSICVILWSPLPHHTLSPTMHPTEKTLKIYKEDNDHLRIKNDQLQEKIRSLLTESAQQRTAISLLKRQNDELAKMVKSLREKTSLPPKRSAQMSPERVQLFIEVEKFVQNYDFPRLPPHRLCTSPSLADTLSRAQKQGLGSYVPANILYDQFLSQSEWEIPPTFHLFCRQLNLLALPTHRTRMPGTVSTPRVRTPHSPPSKCLAKITLYLIPFPNSTTQS